MAKRTKKTNSNTSVKLSKHKKLDVTIYKKTSTGTKLIPTYKIQNGPGFASVDFNLDKDQTILANAGMMSYMDADVKVKTQTHGFFKGLMRGLLTTSSMFLTDYTGVKGGNRISFANFLPGDVVPIIVKPGEKFTLASYGLVCMTANVILETRMRLKGLLLGDNAFLTDVKVDSTKSNQPGMVWVAAYGGYEKLDVSFGDSLQVDNGMFLAAHSDTRWKMSKIGGVKSFLFSGEGVTMKFEGPCTVYIQTRNINAFTQFISKIAETVSGKGKGLGGVLGKAFD